MWIQQYDRLPIQQDQMDLTSSYLSSNDLPQQLEYNSMITE